MTSSQQLALFDTSYSERVIKSLQKAEKLTRAHSIHFGPASASPAECSAAALARTDKPTALQRVFDCIERSGDEGRTDEEIQIELRMGGNTERPRRKELGEAKMIEPCGTRKTTTGCDATVWRVKE